MKILFLIFAIISLVLAHFFKVYRQSQFIEIYEKPHINNLLTALSLGYIVNFVFPFKVLGEIFRVFISGRKMENGYSFALSTIIIDRILDVFFVTMIFLFLSVLGCNSQTFTNSLYFYLILSLILFLMILLSIKYKRAIKKIIKKVASIFNKNIELKILKIYWYLIVSIKDLIKHINKKRLLSYSLIMWSLYLISYYFISIALDVNFVNIFNSLFGILSIFNSSIKLTNVLFIIYLFIPLIVLLLLSFFPEKNKSNGKYLKLIPHIKPDDKLSFLEGYFSAKSQDYYKNYIKINRDISVIQDFSAGSNATTMLCEKNGITFFRKYAFEKDSDKLYEQVEWLKKNSKTLPITEILDVQHGKNYTSYDMPYLREATSCFNFVHSMPLEDGWKIIEKALNSLNSNLHAKNVRKSNKEIIEKYIETKVLKNIEKIENGGYIKPLNKYEEIYINGKKYHNLKYYKKYLSKEFLYKIFKDDIYSDIHGDFTIENIICLYKTNEKYKDNFYIIDPNTGNLHDSPNLDYSKLLQSLHGGYEFLMNTKKVDYYKNKINYLSTKSSVYDYLYQNYDKYLKSHFSEQQVRSIYFHEIIHWLRLMPYKIEKNGERSLLFYSELLIILDDVINNWGNIN